MSEFDPIEIYLADEQATSSLAALLAPHMVAGDVILLQGPIGSGKTHFCRSLIQTRLGRAEDVPSPTFTLVQTYEADVDIWHADLYRLTHPDEARELGLGEAFETAICLIEWPDRLGRDLPSNPIRVELSEAEDGRLARIEPGNRLELRALLQTFSVVPNRSRLCSLFLARCNWQMARRESMGGDASARRYERLYLNGETRLLMDAPPGQADRVEDFAHIDRHLLGIGLSAPLIHAEDTANGFLLIEDFGEGVFARLIRQNPATEGPLYQAAVDVLAHLQSVPPAKGIPDLSTGQWAESAELVLTWYRFSITGDKQASADFVTVLHDLLAALADAPKVMILRDYHAENLMWLPDRQGLQRVGLLDFQLAQMGQPGYDLVSLLQDARRDVGPETETQMVRHYLGGTGRAEADFLPSYACLGALRALRILGIFARLSLVGGKAGYVDLMPRVWQHLQRNLAHPALQSLNSVCAKLLPPPDPRALQRIKDQCGSFQ